MSDITVGYVVASGGQLMREESRACAKKARGVLFFGSAATSFLTKQKAQCAIDRTIRYATERGYKWGKADTYEITRLVIYDHPRHRIGLKPLPSSSAPGPQADRRGT